MPLILDHLVLFILILSMHFLASEIAIITLNDNMIKRELRKAIGFLSAYTSSYPNPALPGYDPGRCHLAGFYPLPLPPISFPEDSTIF